MSEVYWNIDYITDYTANLKRVEAIEDCDDEFLTQEEVESLSICGNGYWSEEYNDAVIESAVRRKLRELLNAIPEGEKSIEINDPHLIAVLERPNIRASYYLEGTKRIKGRLYRYTKFKRTKKRGTKQDCKNLKDLSEEYLSDIAGFEIVLRSYETVQLIDWLKSIDVTSDKMLDFLNEERDDWHHTHMKENWDESDRIWMKKIFDDTNLIPKKYR